MTSKDELAVIVQGLFAQVKKQGLLIEVLWGEVMGGKPTEKKLVEKTATNHRGNNTVGPGIIAKKEEPKPEKDAVKGTRIEYKFEEYINREGECKSYVIYHPDSEQMVKYIAKSLIFEGGPDEDGNLYVKKGSSWVLEKEWVVKKA